MPRADERPTKVDSSPVGDPKGLARRQAIKQIERRRHFRVEIVAGAIGMTMLIAIWATSEYHNAGGWPTHGFSQSSSSRTCGTSIR